MKKVVSLMLSVLVVFVKAVINNNQKYRKEIFIWEPYIFIGLKILILLVIFGLGLHIILSSSWTDTNNTARFNVDKVSLKIYMIEQNKK